jgi:hypothetical protein
VTLGALDVMSRSDDWEERARAARLVATHTGVEADAIVLRLLWDARDTGVCEAMVAALVEARADAAIPLILRALGDQPVGDDGEPADFMLRGLVQADASGLPVEELVESVLVSSEDRLQVRGVLRALAWRAPFGVSSAALARIRLLLSDPDRDIRDEAVLAYAELEGRKSIAIPDSDGSWRYRLVEPDSQDTRPEAR